MLVIFVGTVVITIKHYMALPIMILHILNIWTYGHKVHKSKGDADVAIVKIERASHYHSLRVHHQVIVWETLGEIVNDPLDWGWENDGTRLSLIMTDIEVAHQIHIKI